MGVKIAIIGAGSGVFSLNLIKDICVNRRMQGATLSLMDVNAQRLDAIYGLAVRYVKEMGTDLKVKKTLDRRAALKGADFVVNVALDYGHERLRQGWKVAFDNGYRFGGSLHVVHDEAFWVNWHQVRLMESILQDVLAVCPNAWYVLVANPVQMGVTYLTRKYPSAKIVGMCHGYNGVNLLARAMGLEPEHVMYEVSGVNHFIWLTKFFYKGENAFPLLDAWIEKGGADEWLKRAKNPSIGEGPKAVDLYKTYGAFPIGDTCTPGGGSWGWWYHSQGEEPRWAEDPFAWYEGYFQYCEGNVARIRAAVEDKHTPVSEVFTAIASDEPMVPLIEALACDVERVVIVNVPNQGACVPGVPEDYEVEIPALISKRGIQGIQTSGLPKEIMAYLWRDRIAPVEMEIRAFETGRRDLLIALIMMDPWTTSRAQAEKLLDGILALPCNEAMREVFG
jgi:alpha-galactosidase